MYWDALSNSFKYCILSGTQLIQLYKFVCTFMNLFIEVKSHIITTTKDYNNNSSQAQNENCFCYEMNTFCILWIVCNVRCAKHCLLLSISNSVMIE